MVESTEIITEVLDEKLAEDAICESADAEGEVYAEEPATESPDTLTELYESYPELTPESAEALCNLDRYRELRALGLSVEEAYRATAKKKLAPDNRAHLSVSVGGGGAPASHGISEPELRSAREIFSGMSDAEIRRLYKRVT